MQAWKLVLKAAAEVLHACHHRLDDNITLNSSFFLSSYFSSCWATAIASLIVCFQQLVWGYTEICVYTLAYKELQIAQCTK